VRSEEKFAPRDIQREYNVKTPGENGHPQAKQRSLEQILSWQPSKRTMPADNLILGFHPPPELLENKFLMLMPPSLWYFVTEALTAELQTKCCCGCRGLRSRVLLYSWVEYKLVQPLWKTVWHHLEMSIWGPNNSTPRYVFLDYCCWIELSRMMEMCQKWCCPILLLSANSTGDTMWLLYTWNVVNTTKRLHF